MSKNKEKKEKGEDINRQLQIRKCDWGGHCDTVGLTVDFKLASHVTYQ